MKYFTGKMRAAVWALLACVLGLAAAGGGSGFSRGGGGVVCADGAEDAVIDVFPEDLSYKYVNNYGNEHYAVTGLSADWLAQNPGNPEAKPRLNIIIPVYWDDDENGEGPVTVIDKYAFHHGTDIRTGTDYLKAHSVVSVDFSQADNPLEIEERALFEIEERAFFGAAIEELDFSGYYGLEIGNRAFMDCYSLKKIKFPSSAIHLNEAAFAYCTSLKTADLRLELVAISTSVFDGCAALKTIYIGYNESGIALPIYMGSPGFFHVDNLVFFDKECMERTLYDFDLVKLLFTDYADFANRFTYEESVVFDTNGGDAETVTETKLYGRPLDYVKRENGAWERDGSYEMPSPGIKPGYVYRWTGADSGEAVRDGGSTAESAYKAEWTYALTARIELPAGFILYTDKTIDALAPYVTAEFASDGYTSAPVTGFTLGYTDGAEAFAEGGNTIAVSYGGCEVYLQVAAELPPPLPPPGKPPAWTYWLTAAGGILILAAAGAVLYGLKKKGIFVKEVSVEVVKTETVEVVKEVPVSEGRSLPMDIFTPKEKRVAQLLLLGKSYREIAQDMGVGEATAKTHILNVFGKTEVNSQKAFIARYLAGADKNNEGKTP